MTQKKNNRLTNTGRRIAQRLLLLQSGLAIILIALFALIYGVNGAKSATAGAVINLVPNMVFAAYAFRFGGARAAQHIVRSFYAGETVKMILTMFLFAVAFIFLSEPWLPLFFVFGALMLMHWLIPFLNFKSN